MAKEIVKEYHKDGFTIVWKPHLCIHAAECVKALPQVYNPKEKPWIKIENAEIEELKVQIDSCPSAALSYKGEPASSKEKETAFREIKVIQNGPLLVQGAINITHPDGTTESREKTTALCRCGHSDLKPYCDGAHNREGFSG